MEYLIVFAIAIVFTILAVAGSRRTKAKGKRVSGALTGGLGVFDEAFRPATAQANTIQEVETRMPAPAPLAGDPPLDGDGD